MYSVHLLETNCFHLFLKSSSNCFLQPIGFTGAVGFILDVFDCYVIWLDYFGARECYGSRIGIKDKGIMPM